MEMACAGRRGRGRGRGGSRRRRRGGCEGGSRGSGGSRGARGSRGDEDGPVGRGRWGGSRASAGAAERAGERRGGAGHGGRGNWPVRGGPCARGVVGGGHRGGSKPRHGGSRGVGQLAVDQYARPGAYSGRGPWGPESPPNGAPRWGRGTPRGVARGPAAGGGTASSRHIYAPSPPSTAGHRPTRGDGTGCIYLDGCGAAHSPGRRRVQRSGHGVGGPPRRGPGSDLPPRYWPVGSGPWPCRGRGAAMPKLGLHPHA